MPKRTDLKKILLIGSGPIVIGQACEFDYSGTQACKALREEGYTVVLVNSNPATIMTDPGMADRTYIEPVTWEVVAKIIERERPDALLPTLGGQTGLNLAVELHEAGVLERFGIELLGTPIETIRLAEDRELFKAAGDDWGQALCIEGLAEVAEQLGDYTRAARLFSAADGWRQEHGAPIPPNDRAGYDLRVDYATLPHGPLDAQAEQWIRQVTHSVA